MHLGAYYAVELGSIYFSYGLQMKLLQGAEREYRQYGQLWSADHYCCNETDNPLRAQVSLINES